MKIVEEISLNELRERQHNPSRNVLDPATRQQIRAMIFEVGQE